MKVYPITRSLPGEQVVGVDPILAPEVDASWRHRLNLYPGRALQADALTAEQEVRAGRIATEEQALSPGVVSGLEVSIENDPTDGVFLHIQAGSGLMHSGEDVVVPVDLRLTLKDLRVMWQLPESVPAPPDEAGDDEDGGTEDDAGAIAVNPAEEPVKRFEDWIAGTNPPAAAPTPPTAAILLLQPIEVELLQTRQGQDDPADDPCEEDPSAMAFEDWERRDACRPVLYPWPIHWKPLPPPDDRWRNQLAYTVFREEGRRGPDAAFPWEVIGVPIALIAFDEQWKPLFVDRNSVARAGGKPKRRTSLAPGTGYPFYWQARFDQLLEELADADAPNAPIGDIVKRFRYLPPAGLLAKSACDPVTAEQFFFPSSYVVDAAPVPIEHLDVALEASASLGRYDLFTPDQVRLLIPVPQKVWEPRLLHGEDVDPAFQQAIDDAVGRRTDWLTRRQSVRSKASVLIQALTGLAPAYAPPDDDPGRLEPEPEFATFPIPISGRAHQSGSGLGVHQHKFAGATPSYGPLPNNAQFVVWVFLDPDNPPSQMQVTWYGTVGVQAKSVAVSWGASLLDAISNVTVFDAGPLPPTGRWVRLEVDPDTAGLSELQLTGMFFTAVDGRVTWARAGYSLLTDPSPARESVWISDALPAGASEIVNGGNEPWTWISFTPPSVDPEPTFGTVEAGTPPIRVADPLERLVNEIKTRPIRPADLPIIYSLGLLRFIDLLQAAVDQANDQINFGYLRVQTAMYRLRQSILGDKVADRLVTSPVLAAIAKESTGAAQVTKSLTDIFTSMKSTPVKAEARWWGRETEFAGASIMAGLPNGHDIPNGGVASGGTTRSDVRLMTSGGSRTGVSGTMVARKDPAFNVLNILTTSSVETGRQIKEAAASATGAALLQRIRGGGDVGTEPPPGTPGGGANGSPPPPSDVEDAHPTVDKTIRTTSIAERILDTRAAESKDFCAAAKRDVIKGLLGLAMNVEDLPVPGLVVHDNPTDANQDQSPERTGDHPLIPESDIGTTDNPDKKPYRWVMTSVGRQILLGTGMPARESQSRQLSVFRGSEGGYNTTLFNWITNEADPLDPSDNEANHFAIGSDLLNHAIALLRSAEGRVADYRAVISRAQQTVDELTVAALDSDRRLKEIEDGLTEARHDVATARALLLDETQRVDAINEHRQAVLREHVTFIAYHRPRLTDELVDAPVHVLDPGPTASPVPDCLSHDEPVPPEVHDYLGLLREAPANWFAHVPNLFDSFDRLPVLQNLLQFTKNRSQLGLMTVSQIDDAPATMLGKALGNVRQVQSDVITTVRQQRQAMDLSPLAGESWMTVRSVAPALVGLADLMDATHGRSDVAHLATQELDQIARVSGCLYGHFSKVVPILRLAWAEQFSQYDAAASLRDLSVLPRWGEINVLERREMQELVDWLFLRINDAMPQAVSLMNDLVRTCLLVASHSPVNQILSGELQMDTPLQPGGQVKLTIPAGVRVGMHVLLYKGPDVVARGVVEDLSAVTAAARIIHTDTTETLAQGARVQFTPPPPQPTSKTGTMAMAARFEE